MENVAVRREGRWIDLPAAPHFRLEKEIKNVITVIAKTYHYWDGHMPFPQQRAIARLFTALAAECPLVEPEHSGDRARSIAHTRLVADIAQQIHRDTGLVASRHEYVGWLGLECPSVGDAVWMMRALVASNVLARREGVVLFVPVNASTDPAGERMRRVLSRVYGLWRSSAVPKS
jgi:hypothetical protein